MLEYIRNNIGGLAGIFIVGALAFAFTLSFGYQSEGWGKGSMKDSSIKVDGTEISEAAIRYAMNLRIDRDMSTDSPEYIALRQRVVAGLIERQLLVNLAQKAGISASDDEAQENIIKGEFYITQPLEKMLEELSFQIQFGRIPPGMLTSVLVKDGHRVPLGTFRDESGKFDIEGFGKFIRYRLQIKEEELVEEQRLELIAQRMRQLLVSGITVSEQELRDRYNRETDAVSLSYIKVSPHAVAETISPSPEDLQAWAENNGDKIKQYYETNKYKYTNVEKMARASHILVKADKDASDEDRAAARAKADALLAQVKSGGDFSALAKVNSDDTGSAVKGGDLGYNPKGVMVPEFDAAMFALEPGQVSDVVETNFGFHIIKLDSFREGNISIEEATLEIAEKLYQESQSEAIAEKLANEYLAKLNEGVALTAIPELTNDTGEPLYPNLKIRDSGSFSRNDSTIPGIGNSKEIVEASFALTTDAPDAKKLYKVEDEFVLISLKDRKQPTDDDFKEKKQALHQKLLSTKQATWLSSRIAALTEEAHKAGAIESNIPLTSAAGTGTEPVDITAGNQQSAAPTDTNPTDATSNAGAGASSNQPAPSQDSPEPADDEDDIE